MPSVTQKAKTSTPTKGASTPFLSVSAFFDQKRNFQHQISVEDLDMELMNMNDNSQSTTPCEGENYPSRPESAASDFAGRCDEEANESIGVVWEMPSRSDGFKIVKKNPTNKTFNHIRPKNSLETLSKKMQSSTLQPIPKTSATNVTAIQPTRPLFTRKKKPCSPSKLNRSILPTPAKTRVTPVPEKPKMSSSSYRSKSLNQTIRKTTDMDIFSGHSKIMALLTKRKNDIKKVVGSIKGKRREDEVLAEATGLDEPYVFATLLERYRANPTAYSLNFAASILPKLRHLLQLSNSDYIDVGLHTLEVIVQSFGNTIRQGASGNASSIGVDIAAEQRHERCVKCRKALMDLLLNSAFIVDKMNEEQQLKFNSFLPLLEEITSS